MKSRMCCPLTGAYIPRLLACTLAGFGFISAFDYYVHGKLLMDTYLETPQLWRTPEDMKAYVPFMIAMQFLTAFITAAIYSVGHEGKGCCEGVRFGILLGLLLGVSMAGSYTWMPISKELTQAWFFAGLAMGIGLGVIYSLVYKTPCCGNQSCGAGQCKCKTAEGSCGTKEKGSCGTSEKKGSCGTGS